MSDRAAIFEFAKRWLKKYSQQGITEAEISHGFHNECVVLGFTELEGSQFEEEMLLAQSFEDYDNRHFLGALIFYKFRGITHWANGELLSEENSAWFRAALARLMVLTEAKEPEVFFFKGALAKLQIHSNKSSYFHTSEPEDEFEQDLTIRRDGQVTLQRSVFGNDLWQEVTSWREKFTIEKEAVERIFQAVGTFFSQSYQTIFATDIGEWNLLLTNTEGETFAFTGSLCCDFYVDGIDLSDLIRDILGKQELLLFDDNQKEDVVDYLELDYFKPGQGEQADYREKLVINRDTSSLEYTQISVVGNLSVQKIVHQEAVEELLNTLEPSYFTEFQEEEGLPDLGRPSTAGAYKMQLKFQRQEEMTWIGTFNMHGLPAGFSSFSQELRHFLRRFSVGEIFKASNYLRKERQLDEYIVCSVVFEGGDKGYYYRTEDESMEIGDLVKVPVGEHGHTTVAEIIEIDYYTEEQLPMPFETLKEILKRYEDD